MVDTEVVSAMEDNYEDEDIGDFTSDHYEVSGFHIGLIYPGDDRYDECDDDGGDFDWSTLDNSDDEEETDEFDFESHWRERQAAEAAFIENVRLEEEEAREKKNSGILQKFM